MLSEYTEQQRSNLADLFTHLLTSKAISLSIFKVTIQSFQTICGQMGQNQSFVASFSYEIK